MIIHSDFKDFLISLNKNEVEFLVVGGYAVSVYSRPRHTEDLDIWIKRDKKNAEKALRALNDFGFGSLEISIEDLLKPDSFIQLGFAPLRIDILTDVSGLDFNTSFKNKDLQTIDGVGEVNFISYDDLIINKKLSGREKDIDGLKWMNLYGKNRKKI